MSPTTLPWLITLVFLLAIVVVFVYVALHSKSSDEDFGKIVKKAYGVRKVFFIVFLLFGVLVTAMTITDLPYNAHERVAKKPIEVDVVAHQWRWDIKKTTLPLGEPIVFNVTSADVNHGFGIYDKNLRLLNQTQAMPGYINKLTHTFDKPGSYKILCLEYCGLVHHGMTAELKVE